MKLFVLNHNSVMNDVLDGFDIVDNPLDADRIILWNDLFPVERGLIQLAKSNKIPTIVIQHGRYGSSRYFPPFNEQITADKLLVWGEADKEALVKAGHNPKKIFVTGTGIFSHLKYKLVHKDTNIVFCPEHWDREVPENLNVRNELRKLKGVKIITKIIEGHDPKNYDNPVMSNRNEQDHLDKCIDVLRTADLVVGIAEGTFELLAQAMDIPVVIMKEWQPKSFGGDERYRNNYRRIISKASKTAKLENLIDIIKDQLKNPDELREERKQVCIDEGGINLDAKKEIQRRIIG